MCIPSMESFEPMVTKLCSGQKCSIKINPRGIIQNWDKVELPFLCTALRVIARSRHTKLTPNIRVSWDVRFRTIQYFEYICLVFYTSYFNYKRTRWAKLKHPNYSVFCIENFGPKFIFLTLKVIFELKCNLAPSWLAQTTLKHLKIFFAHLKW